LSINLIFSAAIGNPGASGSLFWITHDDEFIIKTVDNKEAEFLMNLLPGYFMNVQQNPRTLLPKFYGKKTALEHSNNRFFKGFTALKKSESISASLS